jgi:hypothetical protein
MAVQKADRALGVAAARLWSRCCWWQRGEAEDVGGEALERLKLGEQSSPETGKKTVEVS